MEENKLALHSEETEDILKKPPAWIIKWGITMFVVVLSILASLTFIIHYPDLIKTRMVIYAAGSGGPVRAGTSGRLIRLLAGNNQRVKKGDPVAFIEAPLSHEDVLRLSKELDDLKSEISRDITEPRKKQLVMMEQVEKSFRFLFHKDASYFAQVSSGCDHCRASLINSLNMMIAYTDDWKKRFVAMAGQNGVVSLIGLLNEGQQVSAGQPLLYVSNDRGGFYGEAAIPQSEAGKVKKGQHVLIKLASYRYEDFGIINGVIDSIGNLPYNDSVFVARVSFKHTYNKSIILKSGLSAESDIVSDDISLVGRLINTLKKAINP
ncbi:MAG TPA: HlyD family efflux transporter periplasmic adaptor subunit [Mucilaginibacter sp.]|nr:HlyD family efflux transporter periplasmic adaptor subunit [Mucilaginibacter sp.]